MTTTYVGSLSLAVALPAPTAAAVAGTTGINLALPDIEARLAALYSFKPAPIDFAVSLQLAQQIVASIQTAISLGIVPPSLAAQIAEISALIAQLLANVEAINVQLGIILDFQALLTPAGVHAYAYAGPVNQLGSELSAALSLGVPGGSPTDPSNALVLITTLAATWSAMAQIFKVTP